MRIIAVILMVLGVALAVWGFQLSDSIGSEVSEAITGTEPDKVIMYYIAGAVSFVVGLYLYIKK